MISLPLAKWAKGPPLVRRPPLIAYVTLCLAAVLSWTTAARAASFQVDPSSLSLKASANNGLLAVRNLGDEVVRVQVSAFAWTQTPSGDIDLSPTRDLVFFPSLLTIAPHDARNVRIGVADQSIFASTSVEKTYRLIVEELAPTARVSSPDTAVRVLIRMSVPVFLQPPKLRAIPRIEQLARKGTTATFLVANRGNTHFITKKVHLRVTSHDGQTLFDQSVGGWYVLAQGVRAYEIALPATACTPGARLAVELETDQGNAASADLVLERP